MAVNDVWQWTVEGVETSGERAMFGGHYRLTSEGNSDINETALELLSEITTRVSGWQVYMSDRATLTCVQVQKLYATGSRIFTSFISQQGDVASEIVPAQCSVLISKYSNTQTRSARGRAYIPFLSENYETDGVVRETNKIAITTMLQTLYEDVFTDSENNDWEPVVWSRKLEQAYKVTQMVLRPVLATQRKRRSPHQAFSPV